MTIQEKIIDLTHEINEHTLPYPGDPKPEISSVFQIERHGFGVTQVSLGTHTGTHVDAPAHVLSQGKGIGDFDPNVFFGEAVVVDARAQKELIGEDILDGIQICDWLLVCTGQSAKWGTEAYFGSNPLFSEKFVRAAARLARKGLGLDCAGLDRDGVKCHQIWFESGGGLIVENLKDLNVLTDKQILRFAAVPLCLAANDGAPVRALAFVSR